MPTAAQPEVASPAIVFTEQQGAEGNPGIGVRLIAMLERMDLALRRMRSAADAAISLRSELVLAKDFDIPPTINSPQGKAVRICVARDLDFTRVGPMW